MSTWKDWGIAVYLVCAYDPAVAQYYPPGYLTIDGFAVACQNVGTFVSAQVPGVAFFDPNNQTILLNPAYFWYLPTQVKIFIYSHECGHAAVGGNEPAADCFAVKLGRNQGWLDFFGLQFALQYLSTSVGNIWTGHLPGPARVQNALTCYQQP